MFGGVATGVVNAQDAAMPMAITTGYGETPMVWAMEIAIGARSAAAAVFDMNCVRPQESANIAATMTMGLAGAAVVHGTGEREDSRKEVDGRPVHALICLLLREAAREDAEEAADDGGGLHGNVDLLFEHHGDDNTNEDCRADDHLARILCLLLFLGKCLTVPKLALIFRL